MQKEEIFAVLDRLVIDQANFNKFIEYSRDFTREPRCKKGCLAFLEEIFNLPQIEGKDQLAIQLVSTKTELNARKTKRFIEDHPITIGYGEALKQARLSLLKLVSEYVLDISRRLSETTLIDKIERQLYLRRAVARLLTVFYHCLPVTIKTEQWSEVEPDSWIDYLNDDLQTLVDKIADEGIIQRWSSHLSDINNLDNDHNLESIRSYIEYLDTFTEF